MNAPALTGAQHDYRRWLAGGGELFEQVITALYRARLRRGEHAVDVGANHGAHTLPLARCVGPWGRVTAIEALPHLAARLAKRTRWRPQIEVVNQAVAGTAGRTTFNWVRQDEGWSGIRQRWLPPELESEVETLDLPQTTLDLLLKPRRKRVAFVKIDVEGGEFDVIRGGLGLIAEDRPLLVFEHGGPPDAALYGYTRDAFFALFRHLDYAVFDLFGRPLTLDSWDAGDLPWYVIAAPAAESETIRFIERALPPMIAGLVQGLIEA